MKFQNQNKFGIIDESLQMPQPPPMKDAPNVLERRFNFDEIEENNRNTGNVNVNGKSFGPPGIRPPAGFLLNRAKRVKRDSAPPAPPHAQVRK